MVVYANAIVDPGAVAVTMLVASRYVRPELDGQLTGHAWPHNAGSVCSVCFEAEYGSCT